jgi:hypothetical protein
MSHKPTPEQAALYERCAWWVLHAKPRPIDHYSPQALASLIRMIRP